MENIFLADKSSMIRLVVVTAISYIVLIVILRLFGKRTLSKMNAFDFVVTIALGSILASLILDKNLSLMEGLSAMMLLVFLQFLVSRISTRSASFNKLVKSKPQLLLYDGIMLEENAKKERITKDEILAEIREQGIAAADQVKAVVLETDGSLSVIKKSDDFEPGILEDVKK